LGQKPVHVQRKFPGRPTEEESEEFLAKLKLLLEGKLVQSLVKLKLLAEIEMDSSLAKLKFLLEQEMVNLDLKYAEERNLHRLVHQFLLQIPDEE
jgi:hypothetical protein